MPTTQKARGVALTPSQRTELEGLLRRSSVGAGLARRARAILLLADGKSVSETGRLVAMQRRHLYKWMERFRCQGVAGLRDGKRTGRPPVFSPRSRDPLGQDGLRTPG